MARRNQHVRETKTSVYIIGEGITEQYYFSHIKSIFGFHCTIKPRFFGNTSIHEMRKKIENLLLGDICVICVFDTDVAERVESEKKQLIKLQNKYKNNTNVIFCDSLPSIEYWFLLHHEKTNRHFNNSAEVEKLLKKHIKDYKKAQDFLENEKWVKDLCADGKLEAAIQRAKAFGQKEDFSYSNVYLAFEMLTNRNLKD